MTINERRLDVEKSYCEDNLGMRKSNRNTASNVEKTFVYKRLMKKEEAASKFPGCLLSRCCEKKTRMYLYISDHCSWV